MPVANNNSEWLNGDRKYNERRSGSELYPGDVRRGPVMRQVPASVLAGQVDPCNDRHLEIATQSRTLSE